MSKLARSSTAHRSPHGGGPIRTTSSTPDTVTAKGGAGYSRDVKSELFTLAVTNFVSEQTYHESATDRDARYRNLVHQAAIEDPNWTVQLLRWLRTEGNMRSASIVGAIEYGRAVSGKLGGQLSAVVEDGKPHIRIAPTARALLDSILQRADEPGEALGYWLSTYGKPLPRWLQRGLGDAADRLYTARATLKYDGANQPIRFGDVIELSSVKTARDRFKWQMDRKFGRAEGDYGIPMLNRRLALDAMPVEERASWVAESPHASRMLDEAGYTWEALSGWIQGPMTAAAWEAIIPSMGYMALLRNLRNFDEAGISYEVSEQVAAKLYDPDEVVRSRQLPFRFWSAYKHVANDRWLPVISKALDLSLLNVPVLDGRTLILLDGSGSMGRTFTSHRGRPQVSGYSYGGDTQGTRLWEQGALFALALATKQRGNVDFYLFDYGPREFVLRPGISTLRELQRLAPHINGGGTETARSVRQTYQPGRHDRVIVFTDEQADYDGLGVFDTVPKNVPCYTVNICGYRAAHSVQGTPTRHGISGLTDSAFQLLQVLEARSQRNLWPWEIGRE